MYNFDNSPVFIRLFATIQEVQMIAKRMAQQGLNGDDGEILPDLISSRAYNHIMKNRQYFRNAIREYKKNL